MKNYRYTAKEVEQMKDFILTNINNETETRTAWRARLCYSMQANCSSTKKSRDKGARMLALYEQLTTNDLPNWEQTDQETQGVAFHVYAGYYELYLTTKELPEPYMYQTTFDNIDDALKYMEDKDPEATIYCTDTRDYLPDYLREFLDDEEEYHGSALWFEVA